MNKGVAKQTPFQRLPFWIRGSIIFWFLIGVIPIVSRIFGIQFFPSPEWVSLARIPAAFSGAICAVLIAWGVIIGLKINDQGMWKVKKYGVILFTPFIGFVIGSSAVTLSGPMISAGIAGTEIEVPFTVTKFKRSVDRKCRNPITLDDLPLAFDKLCGFSEEFGHSLEIGGQILVIGKGTRLGVFAKSARRVD